MQGNPRGRQQVRLRISPLTEARLKPLLPFMVTLAILGCAPTGQRSAPGPSTAPAPEAQPARTLVAAIRLEPSTLALRPLRETFAAPYLPNRMFNGDFAMLDEQAVPRPYLVEALPQLTTDSWRVFPDGRMETTYRFRPNLTWHDEAAFSAEDYVFGWRVYATPDLGHARAGPFDTMDEVVAPDPRTLVVRWKRPYPDAAHMFGRDRQFPALPRHLLQASYENESADGFSNLLFWSRDYVGLGPYRVARWEPGAFIETAAFDAHATGRARIDRIKLLFVPDANTALANVLGGEVQFVTDSALDLEQAVTLRREWEPRQAGRILWQFNTWRGINFQFRGAFTKTEALLDPRVRKALAYSVDRQGLNDALFDGLAEPADFLLHPMGAWGPAVQRGVVAYSYDPRRSEQLLREAGYDKAPDGILVSPTYGRFAAELKVTAGRSSEREIAALANAWRAPGFEVTLAMVPTALAQDLEVRASYPGMYLLSGPGSERVVASFTAENVPMPENRWRGGNRSGWSNPAYTRLAGQFLSTLEPNERSEQLAQMALIFTDDVAAISLYFPPQVSAHSAGLQGPGPVAPETNIAWNIQSWELR